MKKYIPYILLSLVISAMFILIFNNKQKSSTKIISLDTMHSYLYNNDQLIQIPIYVTGNDHTIDDLDTYENISISNENNHLNLNLNDITYSHDEFYAEDKYKKYVLKFNMPNLTEDYKLENATLNIDFLNNKSISLRVGSFYFKYLSYNSEVTWINLEAKSDIDSNKPQMDIIEITLDNTISNINNIAFKNNQNLNYEITNNTIKISIPNLNLVINYIPLWIIYEDNQVITINNNHFIIDYDLLSKAGKLVNIYGLN